MGDAHAKDTSATTGTSKATPLLSGQDTETFGFVDEGVAETLLDEALVAEGAGKKRKRRFAVLLGILGLFVITAVIVVVSIVSTDEAPATMTITDNNVPLSEPTDNSGSSSSTSNTSSSHVDPTNSASNSTSGSSNTTNPDNSSPTSDAGAGQTGGDSTGGGGGSGLTWYPPWDEQVWVNTSGWQSVYVGESPIYEQHSVCNTCGAIVDNILAEHYLYSGSCIGYSTKTIKVGTTPIYENRWVESGYYTTVTHPGYWG